MKEQLPRSCPQLPHHDTAQPCHHCHIADMTATGFSQMAAFLSTTRELFRRGLTMLLAAEQGIEVVSEASDGLEGADLAATAAPDVVLLDIRMPKQIRDRGPPRHQGGRPVGPRS